jgi:hypothetical protein
MKVKGENGDRPDQFAVEKLQVWHLWLAVGFCGLVSGLVGSQVDFVGVSSGERASILTAKVR